jgi:TonB family protein
MPSRHFAPWFAVLISLTCALGDARVQAGTGPAQARSEASNADALVQAQEGILVSAMELPVPTKCSYPGLEGGPSLAGAHLSVCVRLKVAATGRVTNASVVKSVPGLDSLALAAARQWQFKPGIENGRPIAMDLLLEFHFGVFSRDSGRTKCR